MRIPKTRPVTEVPFWTLWARNAAFLTAFFTLVALIVVVTTLSGSAPHPQAWTNLFGG